jgi:rubredoxin
MKRWQCSVCGYIHEGDEPPEECPVCGADRSAFILLEEVQRSATGPETVVEAKAAAFMPEEPRKSISTIQNTAASASKADDAAFLMALTRLHGHPIAVHIPNGVLPVSLLFTFGATLFHWPSLAHAAKYNLYFVCLAMPLVIFSGVVDWTNRYGRRMSKVFRIKIICALIVSVLTLVLSLWWLVQPEVYMGHPHRSGLFLLINSIDLAAAIVAGWYGGKMVFPKK